MNRLEASRSMADELDIPVSPACTSEDIRMIILRNERAHNQGLEGCFGISYSPTCRADCPMTRLCSKLSEAEAADDDLTNLDKQDSRLLGFPPGTQSYSIVELLQEGPVPRAAITKMLIAQYDSDRSKAKKILWRTKKSLEAQGYDLLEDEETRLISLVKRED